jgi:hypothetical protein
MRASQSEIGRPGSRLAGDSRSIWRVNGSQDRAIEIMYANSDRYPRWVPFRGTATEFEYSIFLKVGSVNPTGTVLDYITSTADCIENLNRVLSY